MEGFSGTSTAECSSATATGYFEGSRASSIRVLWGGLKLRSDWMKLLQRPTGRGLRRASSPPRFQAGLTRRAGTRCFWLPSAGVLALGDTSVMIFACAALALVGVVRLVRLRGRRAARPRRGARHERAARRTGRRPSFRCDFRPRRLRRDWCAWRGSRVWTNSSHSIGKGARHWSGSG